MVVVYVRGEPLPFVDASPQEAEDVRTVPLPLTPEHTLECLLGLGNYSLSALIGAVYHAGVTARHAEDGGVPSSS